MTQEQFNAKVIDLLEKNQLLIRKVAENQRAFIEQMKLLKRLIDAKGYGD